MKIGITFSTFDLLHTGHVLMLKEAKSVCDYLICGLHVDPQVERPNKNKPIQSIVERYAQLSAVKYVDEVIPYNLEKDLHDILLSYPIDVRIIGADYRDVDFSGKQICIDIIREVREIAGVSGIHVMAYRQEELVADIVRESGVIANEYI